MDSADKACLRMLKHQLSDQFANAMPTAAEDTVVVYDASNSMWGQIESEAKVSIARRVMTDRLQAGTQTPTLAW